MHPRITDQRYLFKGVLIRNRIINPTIASRNVAATEMSTSATLNVLPKTTSAAMAKKSVRAAGIALNTTLRRKFPSILRWLASIARKNAGIPILNILISEICEGCRG